MFIFVLAQKEPTKSPEQLTVLEIRDLEDDLRMLVTSVPKGENFFKSKNFKFLPKFLG